jgi:hypothetical protein
VFVNDPGLLPAIAGFTPASGPAGTAVVIAGSNFTSATAVRFAGSNAVFNINSGSSITGTVPTGATTGRISVTAAGGTATTGANFTVTSGAPGPLTNGANHSGVIPIGGSDTWTFYAAYNDRIVVGVGEVVVPQGQLDPQFSPRIRLVGPNGVELDGDYGSINAEIDARAPQAGTYTVIVSNYDNFYNYSQVDTGSYTLRVVKAPGVPTVSPGDEGGPITNGGNHAGVIGFGDLDPWTFEAAYNDRIIVGVGEVVVPQGQLDPEFYPRIRLVGSRWRGTGRRLWLHQRGD